MVMTGKVKVFVGLRRGERRLQENRATLNSSADALTPQPSFLSESGAALVGGIADGTAGRPRYKRDNRAVADLPVAEAIEHMHDDGAGRHTRRQPDSCTGQRVAACLRSIARLLLGLTGGVLDEQNY